MIYLMRHGDIGVPKGLFVGQKDIPLSPLGIGQARSWRSYFATLPLVACITSDLTRCRQTAEAILGQTHVPIILEPTLREISLGEWEGLSKNEVLRLYPVEYAKRGLDIANTRPRGGESFSDLAKRVLPTFTTLAQKYKEQDLLVVAHAGVNRVLLAHLMALPLANIMDIPQPYGACTCVEGHLLLM